MNQFDEMYELNDYDEDIKERKALIEEVKALHEETNGVVDMREVSNLQRRWRKIQYWESAYEDELSEEFDSIIDIFYGNVREKYKENKELKQALIEEIKQASTKENIRKNNSQMKDLMSRWKAIGACGKDDDDALWEEFNKVKQNYFDEKHKNWETMQENFAKSKAIKENLIEKAKELANSKDWKNTSETFKQLMQEWKDAGSAGREYEDSLWNKFQEARQNFYDQRNEYYNELNQQFEQRVEAKKKIIEQAKAIEQQNEYTRNQSDKMKILNDDWKTIGNCGKYEDAVWKEFRSIMDSYFEGLRNFNEKKHENWKKMMEDKKAYKHEQIQNQKRQITRIQQDMVGLLGERAIKDAEESILDKKEYIIELEKEIEEIENALK